METGEKSGANSLTYGTVSLRLLDLLDALYSKVGRIFDKEATARLQSEWNAFISRAGSARSVCIGRSERKGLLSRSGSVDLWI